MFEAARVRNQVEAVNGARGNDEDFDKTAQNCLIALVVPSAGRPWKNPSKTE
jgi:hypothetical protein